MGVIKVIRHRSPHPGRYMAGIVCGIVQHVGILFSFIAIYIGFTWAPDITPERAWTLAALLVAGFLVTFVFGWLYSVNSNGESYKAYCAYRVEIARSLKTAPLGFFSSERLSRILFGITTVIEQVENFSSMLIMSHIQAYSAGAFVLIGMFGVSARLGALALALFALSVAASRVLYRMGAVEMPRIQERMAQLSEAVTNGVCGMSVLRSFPARESSSVERIHGAVRDAADALMKQQIRMEVRYALVEKLYTFLTLVSSCVISLAAAWLCAAGEIPLASALTLAVVGPMLFAGLQALAVSALLTANVPANLESLERLARIPAIADGPVSEAPADRSIDFSHVTFGYDPSRPVLRDLTLCIPEGARTAIVGPSGSGKTTMVNLIARFFEPQSGEIRLGGRPLSEYAVDTLLSQLSLVFQDVYLFDETVMDNIRIARPSATDEEVREAARRARCDEFVEALPQGFDTRVGEGGSRLSGGERQRISIARALLKDAPIILLDEATSSVDPENEHEILRALDELTRGRTVISIAHRLSTVVDADQILVIDEGRLVQQGTHEELSAVPGIYADFLEARRRAAMWTLA